MSPAAPPRTNWRGGIHSQTEEVASLSSIPARHTQVVSAMFVLLCLMSHLHQRPGRHPWWWGTDGPAMYRSPNGSRLRPRQEQNMAFHLLLQNDLVAVPERRLTVDAKKDGTPATNAADSPTAKQTKEKADLTPPPSTNRFNLSLQLPDNQHQGLHCLSGGNKTLPL